MLFLTLVQYHLSFSVLHRESVRVREHVFVLFHMLTSVSVRGSKATMGKVFSPLDIQYHSFRRTES